MATPSKNLTFRLPEAAHQRLQEAAELANRSRHLEARQRVIDSLAREDAPKELAERLDALERSLADLRRDLVLSVEALLIAGTNSNPRLTPEQARIWIRKKLRSAPLLDRPEDLPNGTG